MTLLQVHIVSASAWLGLIAAETVIELMARDRAARQFVAKAHKTIDLYFEGPLVAIMLVTGSLLLTRLWPNASVLLLVKVAVGQPPGDRAPDISGSSCYQSNFPRQCAEFVGAHMLLPQSSRGL